MKRMLLAAVAIVASVSAAAQGVVHEKIIGKEYPGEYKHPASFWQLDNGDWLVSYYGGDGEYEDSKVYLIRQTPKAKKWTDPVAIADTPYLGEGNPVIWQGPDGIVYLFYVQRYGETWSDSRIHGKISKDRGETWSDSYVVAWDKGTMVRAHPIVLNTGEYLLPVYHETGADRENVGSDTSSLFLRFRSGQYGFQPTNKVYSRQGNLQPSAVQISDSHLIAYSRRGGNYEYTTEGWLVRMESTDGGYTWSYGKESEFPNPNSATDLKKLANGHLLLVYNDSMTTRSPLTVAISTDNGATWPYKKNIADGKNSFAYPLAVQAADGKIHILYTTDARTQIMRAIFDESFITNP